MPKKVRSKRKSTMGKSRMRKKRGKTGGKDKDQMNDAQDESNRVYNKLS